MPPPTNRPQYPLNNDEEAKRLSDQHHVIKDSMGGKLVLAPIDLSSADMRILDSGTADGTWLFDLRSSQPAGRTHTLIGTDISPERFTANPPAGMTFEVQNILDPWPVSWRNSFDLVHQRLVLAGAGPAGADAVARLLELVRPGGWVQLIEAKGVIGADDGPAMHHFLALLTEVFNTVGAGTAFPRRMCDWINDAGFINVQTMSAPNAFGAKCANPALRRQSIESTCVAVKGLVAYAKSFPDGPKSMSVKELDTLVPRLRAEMEERGGHYPMLVVWGQKPAA